MFARRVLIHLCNSGQNPYVLRLSRMRVFEIESNAFCKVYTNSYSWTVFVVEIVNDVISGYVSVSNEATCQDPAGNWTTRRPHDGRKETQTAVVWSCFPFIVSGQNHLARHSERGKKTRQTEEEVGRQH